MNKVIKFLLAFTFLMVIALPAMAQTGEPVPPTSPISWTHLLISAATPLVVWLLSITIPKIPRSFLPILAPVAGVGIGYAIDYVTGLNLTWIDGAAAGGFGVWIRETVNQQITKRIASEDGTP